MIEARTHQENATPKAVTPETITTSMIIEDLENGTDRNGIKEKYGLENWEVTQMFKHPALKGKKARKVRKMSFNFVDDTSTVDPNQTSIPVIAEENPHYENPKFTKAQEDQMYGQEWEDQIQAETNNPLNL
tara:strand:- start:1965 stop:2357 length:393 start_codon:yes stop_codon:yes gene_type:complete